MKKLRTYGKPPYAVTVLHGGPGGPGDVAPIAKTLSRNGYSVIEPLQSKTSLNGQIEELKIVLQTYTETPVTLIGHSWGAMLAFVFTAKYPRLIKKLILVSSGAFNEHYGNITTNTRLKRLNKEGSNKLQTLLKTINDVTKKSDRNKMFKQIYSLVSKADLYDPLKTKNEILAYQYDLFRSAWSDMEKLRASGKFLALGKKIRCPVIAIHGDYDPHPANGIKKPLSNVLKNFKFILLKKCGHYPWKERYAKKEFYNQLKSNIE